MASPPLTIRNLTNNPLELKLLERFQPAQCSEHSNGGILGITRKLSGLVSNITSPSSPQLALKAESFSSHDVSIAIGPFETKLTDIQPDGKEVLRLTFEVEGQRYRLDTPVPSQRSTYLTPLSPNPGFEFMAVFLPQWAFLALYSSTKLHSWMGNLSNETPLSALSIPGTHNSPTYRTALPSVRCQSVSILEQLNNGVRFLDIRVQPVDAHDTSKDDLILVHSAFPVALTGAKYFRDLVNTLYSFLDSNPTETVIISLKREGIGRATDQHLSRILKAHYANDRWFTENRIPLLGEARSKIVLIRRFALHDSLKSENNGAGWAIDAESWPDNCADGVCSSGEIRVQDFYEVAEHTNIEKKITFSTDQLKRAASAKCNILENMDISEKEALKQPPFFMNFLSASNFWRSNCWPDRIAAKVNPSIVDYLCRRHNEAVAHETGDGSTGIVVCDWVGHGGDWDLVRCIVGMNSKLEMR